MKKKLGLVLLEIVVSFIMILTGTMMPVYGEEIDGSVRPISLTTSVSDHADIRAFVITNNTNTDITSVRYWSSTTSSTDALSINIAAGRSVKVFVPAAVGLSLIAEYEDYRTSIKAYDAYNMPIYYVINGVVATTYSIVNSGNGIGYTAPLTFLFDNESYAIIENNYKEVPFGTKSISFQYEKMDMPTKTSTVLYVDQNGILLTKKTFEVTEKDGGNFIPDTTITIGKKSYQLMSGQATSLTPSYIEGERRYTYRYMLRDESIQRAYNITVQSVYDGMVLDTKLISVYPGQSISYDTSDTIVANHMEYRRSSDEAKTIHHEYDNAKRMYSIHYEKVKRIEAYQITIHYVNLNDGKILKIDKAKVDMNKTIYYEADNSFTKDGNTYILSGSQSKKLMHTFGQDQLVYNVYYHQKGKEIKSYDVKVMYFDITKNQVISSKTVKAESDQDLTIKIPSEMNKGNTSFVCLGGQSNTIQHDFYSRRRTYIFFYRDKSDTKNAETIVKKNTDGNVIATTNRVITVNECGDVTIKTEDGELLIHNDKVIKENKKALSTGKAHFKDDSFAMMCMCISVGFLIIVGLILILIKIKHRKI